MNNDNLEQRAVAALRNDGVWLTELTELICEVESALTAAAVIAEETRREGIDHVLSPSGLLRARVRAHSEHCAFGRAASPAWAGAACERADPLHA